MKISVSRLQQIIKEEMENIAEYERAHEGKTCGTAHPGVGHEQWAEGERPLMSEEEEYSTTNEELEDILAEDDWDFLGEDDLYEE
jgi:hypothetical protein